MARRKLSARQRALIINRLQTRGERAWFRELRRFFRVYTITLSNAVKEGGRDTVDTHQDQFGIDLTAVLRRLYRNSINVMRDQIYADFRHVSGKTALEVFEQFIIEWIDVYTAEKVKALSSAYFGDIKSVMEESFREGLGQEQTARAIRERVGTEYAQWKAARIARTENHVASEIGTREAVKSLGVDTVKEWSAAEDLRTRPTHVAADGQIRELDEPFDVGNFKLMQPGDVTGPPEEIINCRCVALYHPRIDGEIIR